MKPLHEKKISELPQVKITHIGKKVFVEAEVKEDLDDFPIGLYTLRQWAIAIVKDIRKCRKKTKEELKKICCPECGQPRPSSLCLVEDTTVYVEKWIMETFNLTEEDLK